MGEKGNFYGFPLQGGQPENAVKVAMHYVNKTNNPNICTPETINREVAPEEVEMMKELLSSHIPALAGELKHTATCMYTVTPDEHL